MNKMNPSQEPELKRQKTNHDTDSNVHAKFSAMNDQAGSETAAQDSSEDTSDLEHNHDEASDE